jgi:spore coat polysaccharide biosynthesis protein SpsF (cytidylyltransferase family)
VTVACIVQARLGSTRLPAKVLLPLPTGRTVLEEVLYRCKQIPGVDVVACAVPDSPENRILMPFMIKAQVPFFLGSEHDVLSRYAFAAEELRADVIMRVTSDCPLLDPQVCGKVLERFKERPHGYVSNTIRRSWPHGLDCEVFERYWLDKANADATEPYDREHVTPYMQRLSPPPEQVSTSPDRSHLRWTLDTMEKGPDGMGDYERIWRVLEEQMREAA